MDWLMQHMTGLTFDAQMTQWAEQWGIWFYVILFAIIFCETGLVVTPFLPGDSLLFLVGALIAREIFGDPYVALPLMLGVLIVAAVLGDATNYAIGYVIGPRVFRWETSWLLNKKHLIRTQEFYVNHGGKTIFLARFMPIIRTFAPFVAGIGQMDYRRFSMFNVTGGIAWVTICIIAGYYFGELEWVKKHFELVVVAIILISVMPLAYEWFMARRRAAREKQAEALLCSQHKP